jgi:UDP-glucose 4-epimerase
MKILITGCAGFVGGSVAAFASANAWQVLGLARSAQPALKMSGEYLSVDVATSRLAPVIEAFGPDVIFHAAGSASVGRSLQSPLDDLKASVLTFANLLEGVREAKSRALVVFPSSAAVYGNPPELPVREDTPLNPISPYGFHKLACELLAREFHVCYDISVLAVRLFSVFGREQRRLLLWELVQRALSHDPHLVIHGTGRETRDYLPVGECMDRIFRLIKNPSLRGHFTAVNLAGGIETSVNDLAGEVLSALGISKPLSTAAASLAGDPVRWRADTALLQQLAGPLEVPALREAIVQCVLDWKSEFPSGKNP